MSSNIRSWLVWLIPFFVSFGMAFGTFNGPSSLTDAAMQEGPAGDIAGAAGALVFVINLAVGFVMAALTIIMAKVLRRSPPDRILLRLVLSFVGAIILGTLTVYADEVTTEAAWFLVIAGPVLLAWFCGTQRPLPALREAD